jgi:TonB family protein
MISIFRRLLVLLVVFAVVPIRTQPRQASTRTSLDQTAVYSDTSESFRGLIVEILESAKSKNIARTTELIHGLLMPEDAKWFVNEFGPGFGASSWNAYQRLRPTLEEELHTIFEADAQKGFLKPKVVRFSDAASTEHPVDNFLNCMNDVVSLYQTAVDGNTTMYTLAPLVPGSDNKPMKSVSGDPNGYFAFVQGGFRYIPAEILLALPSQRPVRIHLDMEVMQSKLINNVLPPFPWEAVRKHISGVVRVQMILDVDGNIKESKVLEGDPVLSESVMQAVKKWRFAPTTLDGDPVEVVLEYRQQFDFH